MYVLRIMIMQVPLWAEVLLEQWAKNHATLWIIHHESCLVRSGNINKIIIK